MTNEPSANPPCIPFTVAHPSPWAFISHQQVGAELIELTHASDAVLEVAALKFDEQGQEDETIDGRRYYKAMAEACRWILRAKGGCCNGDRFPINPDAPDEGSDIYHESEWCPRHGVTERAGSPTEPK